MLATDPVLRLLVLARLEDRWSPHAIAAWLRKRGDLRCCAESIYRAAYANDDRAGLPAGTWKLLPANRRRRRARGRGENCKRGNVLGPIVAIAERPKAAADRSEAGHWEGDLIKGAGNASGVITLVDRATRFTLLGKLPINCSAAETLASLIAMFAQVPAELRHSLTWDQGREMASWQIFVKRAAMAVYFCAPHSPWQRPSNENINRQLRRWLPKGTDSTRPMSTSTPLPTSSTPCPDDSSTGTQQQTATLRLSATTVRARILVIGTGGAALITPLFIRKVASE